MRSKVKENIIRKVTLVCGVTGYVKKKKPIHNNN